jgi:phosphonatase-like hydrolase
MSLNTEGRQTGQATQNSSAAARSTSSIRLAVLDMAGTTVADDGLVLQAFEAAATAAGLPTAGAERQAARQYVLDTMGQSKIEVFRALFADESRAQTANAAFEHTYDGSIDGGVSAIPGAAQAISALREAGVRVALTTGFSPATQHRILAALGWQGLADLVLAPGEGGRGRPHPDLVLNAVLRSGVDDVAQVAVVGDTANDILTGRRAGASIVAGVLTGAHHRDALLAAGATHVLDSVAGLPGLLLPS